MLRVTKLRLNGGYAGSIYKKIRTHKTRMLLAIGACLAVVALTVLILQVRGNSKSCTDILTKHDTTVQSKRNVNSLEKAYGNLKAEKNACLGEKKVSTGNNNAEQFSYYYTRAVDGYMLGEFETAKADAQKGLDLYNKLSPQEKGLPANSYKVKALEYVKAGTY